MTAGELNYKLLMAVLDRVEEDIQQLYRGYDGLEKTRHIATIRGDIHDIRSNLYQIRCAHLGAYPAIERIEDATEDFWTGYDGPCNDLEDFESVKYALNLL